jgi:hypothetical protein
MDYVWLTLDPAELKLFKQGMEAAADVCAELQRSATTLDGERMAAIAAAKIRGVAATLNSVIATQHG